tara:strand:+ start:703 stop:2376 length:1674 start_codon:yes stop_codon:yes gene_type:complete
MADTENISTDVNDYTKQELYDILELNTEDVITEDVIAASDEYIRRYTDENNTEMADFFREIQTRLVEDLENTESENLNQTEEWYKYQALPQSNSVQRDKNTNRVQKIDVFNNQEQVPMNREHLGINNNFNVDVAQDTLNPNLTNMTTRFINLDSQFRQAAGGLDTASTDYTLDLSDPLTNVLSMRLYCIQIPYTWYVIDNQFGNTCFWITNQSVSFQITVNPGNYSPADFVVELNRAIKSAGFSFPSASYVPAQYSKASAKITITLIDESGDPEQSKDPNGVSVSALSDSDAFNAKTNAYFTFFDFSGEKTCMSSCTSNNSFTFNNTLGWIMGFRLPILPIMTSGNTGVGVLDIHGPKYFILVLDDYNQNHINNGVVTITELSTSLAMPSYYNPTQPHECNEESSQPSILTDVQSMGEFALLNNSAFLTASALGKTNVGYGKTATVLPTAPRTLTQAQLYTINQITKNREKNTSYRGKAPNNSDTFAIIPIDLSGNAETGKLYTDSRKPLQDNKRIYFGPVDIDRMHIKLVDDRGFTVDLHGAEWCLTIIAEILYQY